MQYNFEYGLGIDVCIIGHFNRFVDVVGGRGAMRSDYYLVGAFFLNAITEPFIAL
jgi:hypothetical protein